MSEKQPLNHFLIGIFPNNQKSIINLTFLNQSYQHGRLKNAHIFANLFGLNPNSQFKQTTEEQITNIFTNFNIKFKEWNLFISFLTHGFLPENDRNLNYLEIINELCNKFGGVPSFDQYYQQCYQQRKEETKNVYNPKTPDEDIKNKYDWHLVPRENLFTTVNNHPDYSATGKAIITANNPQFFYYRKLKKVSFCMPPSINEMNESNTIWDNAISCDNVDYSTNNIDDDYDMYH